jgi:hypothetical protein
LLQRLHRIQKALPLSIGRELVAHAENRCVDAVVKMAPGHEVEKGLERFGGNHKVNPARLDVSLPL